jgi:hypothetical protein
MKSAPDWSWVSHFIISTYDSFFARNAWHERIKKRSAYTCKYLTSTLNTMGRFWLDFVLWVYTKNCRIWFWCTMAFVNSVSNKEELPDQWKESIIVPIHKKGDKTDCKNYRGISLQSDRLCGLVVRVLGYRSGGPSSILGTTRKKSSGSGKGVHSASWVKMRIYLIET